MMAKAIRARQRQKVIKIRMFAIREVDIKDPSFSSKVGQTMIYREAIVLDRSTFHGTIEFQFSKNFVIAHEVISSETNLTELRLSRRKYFHDE
jgi:hypothetical protein